MRIPIRIPRPILGALLAAVLAAGTLPVLEGLGVFSDSDTVGSNSFDTGTVALSTQPTSALLSLTDMFPGDEVVAPLTLSNGGSGELRYAMTSSVTESTLSASLALEIKSGLSSCDVASMDDGTLGTVVADTTLDGAAFGDPSQGAQSGDRTLAAGASEDLCFMVRLPLSADNSLQGLSTSADLTFSAEQTRNNP